MSNCKCQERRSRVFARKHTCPRRRHSSARSAAPGRASASTLGLGASAKCGGASEHLGTPEEKHLQEGAGARSVEGRASASTIGKETNARSAVGRASAKKEPVQGVRRGKHLPAQPHKEPVHDVQGRQGRLDAARSRGALASTLTDSTVCHGCCTSWAPVVSSGVHSFKLKLL